VSSDEAEITLLMLKQAAMPSATSSMHAMLSTPSILVVDASTTSQRMVSFQLKQGGYEVFSAMSARQALDQISNHGLPHLALVALDQSAREGLAFCNAVCQFSALPIMILSYSTDEELVANGLRQHAVDCLRRPFSSRELLERVRQALRRVSDFSYTLSARIQIDERLALDFARQYALIADQQVALTQTESKLLFILVSHGGRTVSSKFLRSSLWPDSAVCKENLRVYIRNLRKKIEPDPAAPRYIISERGVGYCFLRTGSPHTNYA
jgi:DNA-binding response OmpR family regulator